jgi:hypothetical protein
MTNEILHNRAVAQPRVKGKFVRPEDAALKAAGIDLSGIPTMKTVRAAWKAGTIYSASAAYERGRLAERAAQKMPRMHPVSAPSPSYLLDAALVIGIIAMAFVLGAWIDHGQPWIFSAVVDFVRGLF